MATTLTKTGTVSWPGAAQNGASLVLHCTYEWLNNSQVQLTVWTTGGCGDAAGSTGANNPGAYSAWANGTIAVNGSNIKTGLFIVAYSASSIGCNNRVFNISSSFKVKFNYYHQYSVAVTCSCEITVPYAPPVQTGASIYNGSTWDTYQPYIYNGSSWEAYEAYFYNGSSWVPH